MTRHTLTIAACLALAAGPLFAAGSLAKPVVGEAHPEFTLRSAETGKPASLSDFRGKKVLLIHWAGW